MANSPKSRFGDQPEDLHEQNSRDVHEGSPHRPDEFDSVNPARLKEEAPGGAGASKSRKAPPKAR